LSVPRIATLAAAAVARVNHVLKTASSPDFFSSLLVAHCTQLEECLSMNRLTSSFVIAVLGATFVADAASAVNIACRAHPDLCTAAELCSSELLGEFGELSFSHPRHAQYARNIGLSCPRKIQKPPRPVAVNRLREGFINSTPDERIRVQTTLKDLGHYNFPIDGLYGRRTSAALTGYNNQYLNGSDLTNLDNVRRLIDAILSVKIEEPAPPIVSETKPEDDEVREAASGSGFAVSSDGYVITNNHVIEGCQEVAVYDGGRAVPVTVMTYDLQNDLALLKGDFSPQTVFALSGDQPELMQDIYVAGYPFGIGLSSSR
jgi:S1-C subfamily serine protease